MNPARPVFMRMTVPLDSIRLLRQRLEEILTEQLPENGRQWLFSRVDRSSTSALLMAFVAAPRFTGKQPVSLSAERRQELAELRPGFRLLAWPLDRVTRLYLLLQLPLENREAFIQAVETLFDTAEMNELVALYASLPVLPYPEAWLFRATEAVRSNMGLVFEALALGNPYPSEQFPEPAWNQLVMKTIFNDKSVGSIVGLVERSNPSLARILVDFAHERWAAGRYVPARAWQMVVPFVNESMLPDLQRLFTSDRAVDRQAAALLCNETNFEPARALGRQFPVEHAEQLRWENLDTQLA